MRKITDLIKSPEKETISLEVLVSSSTGELKMVTDAIIDGFDKDCETFVFELTKPTFEVISAAVGALYGVGGNVDTIGAGKVIFDSCYLGNQGDLSEIQQLPELYAGLCAKCSDKAELAYVNYKKK